MENSNQQHAKNKENERVTKGQKKEKQIDKPVSHDQWFGDEIKTTKNWPNSTEDDIIRIYSQNLNGVSHFDNYSEWEVILEELNERQVDVACLTEINLDVTKPEVKYALVEKLKTLDKGAKIIMTASKTTTQNTVNKRGGVLTLVRGNWAGRVEKAGCDDLGRWTYVTMEGKNSRRVMIITLYRVCNQRHQQGSCTIYMQQELDLKQAGRKQIDPRESILEDLTAQIQKGNEDGYEVIILGDCNDDVVTSKRIKQFLTENNLYNPITARHNNKPPLHMTVGENV